MCKDKVQNKRQQNIKKRIYACARLPARRKAAANSLFGA